MKAGIDRCSHCVVPLSLPTLQTDDRGVCQFCRRIEDLTSSPQFDSRKREKEFSEIVERVKKLGKPYDCLISLSGGKDSTYALYVCDKIHNLKCLCVTFDNGFLSDYAKNNIKSAIEATRADHVYYTANINLMKDLYRLFLTKCGNFCSVCMRGIEVANQIAVEKFKPPLVISGVGKKVGYIGIFPELFEGGDVRFFRNVVRDEPIGQYVRAFCSPWTGRQISKGLREALRLVRLHNTLVGRYTYHLRLYDYLTPDFATIKATIEKEMGWKCPDDNFEHMDCQLHDIPPYIHSIKFPGLTPTALYNSGLIRLGHMKRDEALRIEEKNLLQPKKPRGLREFLEEIDLNEDEFHSCVADWRRMGTFRDRWNESFRAFYRRHYRD